MKLTKFNRHLNDILRNLCSVNNFFFLSNVNIPRYFFCQDGVLNKDVLDLNYFTWNFTENFVDFINNINNYWQNKNLEIVRKQQNLKSSEWNYELMQNETFENSAHWIFLSTWP